MNNQMFNHCGEYILNRSTQAKSSIRRFMSTPDVFDEPWFPHVVTTTDIKPSNVQPPIGFDSFDVPIPWDTLCMIWPSDGLPTVEGLQTWIEMEGKWGNFDSLKDAKTLEWSQGPIGPVAKIDSGKKGIWRLEILPFDDDGHGSRIAEYIGNNPYVAQGGVSWNGRDILLLWRDLSSWPTADQVLTNLLISERLEDSRILVESCGVILGEFHAKVSDSSNSVRYAKPWNERLKMLEERTSSRTLWRAPHGKDTVGCITHRNFGLENIVVLNDASGEPNLREVHILHPASGIYGALLPMIDRAPGLRDLASGYRSLELNDYVIDLGMSIELRRCLFDGWCSTAPSTWSSAQSLDSHKGGVPIWEYEKALEELIFSEAFGRKPHRRTSWFLSHVSRIQAGMFRARTVAAGALSCLAVAGLGIYSGMTGLLSWNDSFPLMLCALPIPILRQLYRNLAPPPY